MSGRTRAAVAIAIVLLVPLGVAAGIMWAAIRARPGVPVVATTPRPSEPVPPADAAPDLAPAPAPAAPTGEPGLALAFERDGAVVDRRVARLLALRVPAGQPPSTFSLPGPFVARFAGSLDVATRGEYAFRFTGTGTLNLELDGKSILDGADLTQGRVHLRRGRVRLDARYLSPATGDAVLRLEWSSREFHDEPLPPAALAHAADPALTAALDRRQGRADFARLHCARCHDEGTTPSAMPELANAPPELSAAGARFHPAWLAHWIEAPDALRPDATMPRLLHGEYASRDARDVAAFLATLGTPAPEPDLADPDTVLTGATLFQTLGCVACHTPPKAGADPGRVPLAQVPAKWRAAALVAYLQDPQSATMPDFRLDDDQARALAAFLLADARPEPPPPGDARRGETLARSLGCFHCHAASMGGAPLVSSLQPPKAPRGARGCLAADDAARGAAPRFVLGAVSRTALVQFLDRDQPSLATECAAEYAERRVRALRCTSCHALDGATDGWSLLGEEIGESRPALTWAGEKLRADWLRAFIAGEIVERPRPWLKARMPGFREAAPLAHGLAQLHGIAPETPGFAVDPARAAIGRRLVAQTGGFACVTCHAIGDDAPPQVFEAPGINLAASARRLRREFFMRWVLDPLRVDPATRMPPFARADGKTGLTDVLGGDARAQFDAIWHFVQTLAK